MKRFSLFCFLFLLSCLIIYIFSEEFIWNWTSPAISESKKRGERIARSIAEFKRDRGRLPSVLDELIPGYLNNVPKPTAGGGVWRYRVTKDGGSFVLAFGMPEKAPYYFYPKCTFDPQDGTWYLDE